MSSSLLIIITFAFAFSVSALVQPPRGGSRLFLDTADVAEWDRQLPLGIWHGITTNPTLCEKAGIFIDVDSMTELAHKAFDRGVNEFMMQAWGESAELLATTGRALRDVDPQRVVVKVPLSRNGIEAASILRKEGTRICMTACYTSHQAFTAAALNAEYVAPYLGRMIDSGRNGMAEVKQMHDIVNGLNNGATRVFVASLRSTSQLSELAAYGLDTFTFSPAIADDLTDEPLTLQAETDFHNAVYTSRNRV
jgi:transaldolase